MAEAPLAYKVLAYPRLGMRLELGAVYTRAELETRCGRRHPERRALLQKKLANIKLFKPVSLSRALKRVLRPSAKRARVPKWAKPPVILSPGKAREVSRRRMVADGVALGLLRGADAAGTAIDDQAVLSALRAWAFSHNSRRRNVIPAGQHWVYSDTLGLTRRRDQRTAMSALSRKYPNFTRLLMRWFRDHRPQSVAEDFPVTSISVNSLYAAMRHRDKNNAGPSVIRAFGSFRGGALRYWPTDSGRGRVENLSAQDAVVLRVRAAAAVFDGKRAHEVTPFRGQERFSLVFFTVGKYWEAPAQVLELCGDLGFCYPSSEGLRRAREAVCNEHRQ